MVTERHRELKADWERRALSLSATKRAVLFKRLPTWLNLRIHRLHMQFIRMQISHHTKSVLDIGCGYGRVSSDLKLDYPHLEFSGVELSEEFSRMFEMNLGPCFNGPIEDYSDHHKADLVLSVTLLMYVPKQELRAVLSKIWSHVSVNGSLVVIEPAIEIMQLWRRLTFTESASPTGGNVAYFENNHLLHELTKLPGADLVEKASIRLIPKVNCTTVHHGICIKKSSVDI